MKSSNDISELRKLSANLAPKSGCRACKLILIAAIILFISSLLLAAFELGKSHMGVQQIDKPRVLSAEQQTDRIRVLQEFIREQQGDPITLVGKDPSK